MTPTCRYCNRRAWPWQRRLPQTTHNGPWGLTVTGTVHWACLLNAARAYSRREAR